MKIKSRKKVSFALTLVLLLSLATAFATPASANQQVTIIATASPSDGGSVSGEGTYAIGVPFTLKAVPNPGWTFNGWYYSNEYYSNEQCISVDETYSGMFGADWAGIPTMYVEARFSQTQNQQIVTSTFYGEALHYKVTPMTSSEQDTVTRTSDFAQRAVSALLNDLRAKDLLDSNKIWQYMNIVQNIDIVHYLSAQFPDGSSYYNNTSSFTDADADTGKITVLLSSIFLLSSDDYRKGAMTHETFHALTFLTPDSDDGFGFAYYDWERIKWVGSGLDEAVTDYITNKAMLLLDDGFEKIISNAYEPFVPIAEWFYENYGDSLFIDYFNSDVSRFVKDFDAYEDNGWNNFMDLLDAVFTVNSQQGYNVADEYVKRIQPYLDNVIPTQHGPIDTANEWARPGIQEALAKGFIPSNIQNNYTNVITRAEFCVMAVKWVEYALGKDIDAILAEKGLTRNLNAFSDTTNTNILAAYALGITSGEAAPTPDKPGVFNPAGQFNRQQAATMIMNTCRAIGKDVSNPPASDFTDMRLADGWAHPGINFVRANGIMNGKTVNPPTFDPKGTFTRQESIVTFNNISAKNPNMQKSPSAMRNSIRRTFPYHRRFSKACGSPAVPRLIFSL